MGKLEEELAKHAIKSGYDKAINRAPMEKKHSVILAFIVAFMFGFLGYGIMTQDWKAAGWLFVMTFALFFIFPGIGLIPAGLICGAMAALRVHKSNEEGGHY